MLTSTLALDRRGRGLLRDAQAVHRTLAHATDGHALWGSPDGEHLIVRHPQPVRWATAMRHIAQAVTLPTTTPITGAHVQWAIIANPTHALARPGQRGKVVPLPPEKWNSWVERKLGQALNLHTIDGTALPAAVGHKRDRRTTHRRVLFQGTATVRNHDTLATLMTAGVGRGKAYGCGLLLIEQVTA